MAVWVSGSDFWRSQTALGKLVFDEVFAVDDPPRGWPSRSCRRFAVSLLPPGSS